MLLTELAFVVYGDGVSTPNSLPATSPNYLGVRIERTRDVLTFTLDNAANGNQINAAMFDAMLPELLEEAARPRVRVLRIRALGEVFCTGRERAGHDVESIRRESLRLIEFKRALRASPLISIAEVQGDAYGFGFGLAIVCDFALVAESAALGFPEMRFGLAPSAIMAYLGEYALPRFAFPLVLFGDPISAPLAMQYGLISQVCAPDRLSHEADALTQRILRLDAAAVRRCKDFFLTTQQNSFDQNCRLAAETLTLDSVARLPQGK
jgi:methylglutaconyl-CoA hydratase